MVNSILISIVFTLNIGTPELSTIIVLKLVCPFGYQFEKKTVGGVANNVDPDQMPHSVASDLGLHCLLRLISPNT